MRNELERIKEIEDYLLGKLNEVDQLGFEQKVNDSIVLAREVEFQRVLMNRVVVYSIRQSVAKAHKGYKKKDNPFIKRFGFNSFFILLVVLLGVCFYHFFKENSSIMLVKAPIDLVPVEGVKSQSVTDSLERELTYTSTNPEDSMMTKPIADDDDTIIANRSNITIIQKPKRKKISKPIVVDMVRVEGDSFEINDHFSLMVKSFELSKHEVTQAQWHSVMGVNPSHFQNCDQCPVEQVSWEDIQRFIQKLNKRNKTNYRLPTHPEWSYAVRGGNKRSGFMYYKDKAAIRKMSWCTENSDKKTHQVGLKAPNELGIYDLNGNVWEWVADVWPDDYDVSFRSTHRRAKDKSDKMLLGGSFAVSSKDFYLVWYLPEFTEPSDSSHNLGFRLARSIE